MFRIKVIQTFSAAHSLRGYKGKCESLHGHNWRVEAVICGSSLNATGMVIDFGKVKEMLTEILDELDHTHLNKIAYFRKNNPSSEHIAKYIYQRLEAYMREKECKVEEICIWETDTSCAAYSE
ncbi:MAG: 6-carboxytetrahydropterin synthase QueD [Candidatus Omnitrophota bacterium]